MHTRWLGGLLLVSFFLFSGVAAATTFYSGAGATITINPANPLNPFAPSFTGSAVAIGVHPLWQPNNPDGTSAVWISFADTGYGGADFQPPEGNQWVSFVTESFTSSVGEGLFLKVWADDTSQVVLDGNILKFANFTQNICADGPIGCQPNEFGLINVNLAPGPHTLDLYMYQVGTGGNTTDNPFGILYYGQVPEPASLLLLGAGLVAVVIRRRK